MDVNWLGFLFYVTFELNNHNHQSLSSPFLHHPFYLSFESECTEECFDMSLDLERNTVDGKNYLWTIYISREHCHFVQTGAQITFKARKGLIIKEWGLRVVTKKSIDDLKWIIQEHKVLRKDRLLLNIDNAEESNTSYEPKIQLPYNWFVSDEDKAETDEAKGKENDLFNIGLLTDRPQ